MPYDFLIGNKSNLSPDPSKKPANYQESLRTKLTMDPKAMFIASPAKAGTSQYIKQPRDFYNFPSVKIGDQVWMSENLDITTTFNGVNMTYVWDISGGGFDAGTTGVIESGVLNNNDTGIVWSWRDFDYQGLGYDKWYSYAMVENLIRRPPSGWRMPTEADFDQLISYLGGNSVAGGYLKGPTTANKWNQTGYTYISYANQFNAMPSGIGNASIMTSYQPFYDSNVPSIEGSFCGPGSTCLLPFGLFETSFVSAFWCIGNVSTNSFPFYYINWNTNAFIKSNITNYFNVPSSEAIFGFMPIRLIRDY